jgi:Flp pilus assembly protein TadD
MRVSSTRFCTVWVACASLLLSSACASYRGARLYQSGTEALDRGEVEVAIVDLERAALLVAHASEIQNHLGLAYTQAGRHAAAFAAFRRAVDLDCGNAAAEQNLRVAQALERTSSASTAGSRRDAAGRDAPEMDAAEGDGQ